MRHYRFTVTRLIATHFRSPRSTKHPIRSILAAMVSRPPDPLPTSYVQEIIYSRYSGAPRTSEASRKIGNPLGPEVIFILSDPLPPQIVGVAGTGADHFSRDCKFLGRLPETRETVIFSAREQQQPRNQTDTPGHCSSIGDLQTGVGSRKFSMVDR